MAAPQLKVWGTLHKEVVANDLCMFCGTCIASCPVNVLIPTDDERPTIKGMCVLCGLCYHSCPRIELPIDDIEERLYGRVRNEQEAYTGVLRGAYSVRSTDPKIRSIAQDSGATTSILTHALSRGFIDCTVTAGMSESDCWRPRPRVSRTAEELFATAKSKYSAGAQVGGVADAAVGNPGARVGLVGLPCQIEGARRLATSPLGNQKIGGHVRLAIGIFCVDSFKFNKLFLEFVQSKNQIPLRQIEKVDIKNNRFILTAGEKVLMDLPVEELNPYVLPACSRCQDFTAELSDISIGAVGSPKGWTTVLVRSEFGEEVFKSALDEGVIESNPLSEVKPGLSLVIKLSKMKKQRQAPYIRHRSQR
ncbi:MAG: Coenzyme F420 hydrogenase/dehydrogenase, beta subunit C-terminal domain [Candidatus Bathyarchaeia archaeon]